jgi:hypothetical protein
MTTLEAEFHEDMLETIRVCKKAKYNPNYFQQMVAEHGGVGAAKRLLAAASAQTGLTEMYVRKLLDQTAEAHVLKQKYRALFTEEEIAIARQRLQDLGYREP